jgi:alpha-maltose-1-phosphate synthase
VTVIHNGIDTDEYAPDPGTEVLERRGIDPARPSVVFVGRIARQKGLPYLLQAARSFPADAQLVLCAGAPDTPELASEVEGLVALLRAERGGVVWISEMLSKPEVIQILSHATVFCCPSVYEPMGIVNLEAMACGAAVVATDTGGIPDVVDDGVTGLLVPVDQATDGTGTPLRPERFVADLTDRVTALLAEPALAARMGAAGRERAVARFSWAAIASQTQLLYQRLRRG